MHSLKTAIAAVLLGSGMLAAPAWAHTLEEHAHHMAKAAAEHAGQPAANSEVTFADVTLLDQNGQTVRLKDDLVADRIVVLGFVYTSCTTVCPVISAIMAKLQKQLDERAGDGVRLVTLSIDPLRDTPARLREFAGRYQAGPGWTWLTGSTQAVDETLKGLGTWTPNYQEHPPLIMVGDGRSGVWSRFYGFTDPALLLAKVDELHAAREHDAHAHHVLAQERQP